MRYGNRRLVGLPDRPFGSGEVSGPDEASGPVTSAAPIRGGRSHLCTSRLGDMRLETLLAILTIGNQVHQLLL